MPTYQDGYGKENKRGGERHGSETEQQVDNIANASGDACKLKRERVG
ncbi:hypothetical protein Trydic_g20373, partial [Trypoxylus dichotomus]